MTQRIDCQTETILQQATKETGTMNLKASRRTIHPSLHRLLIGGLIVLLAGVMVAESWQLVASRRALNAGDRDLAQRKREWKRLSALDPAPPAGQSADIDNELAEAEETLAALQAESGDRGRGGARPEGAVGVAGPRSDAPEDVAELIRGLHDQARRLGVNVRSDEQFGLDAIKEETSRPGMAASVPRQIEATNSILQSLFVARPAQLVSVQRVRPRELNNRATAVRRRSATAASGAGDPFDADPRLSVREPGLIETTMVRLVFVGRTGTLRHFLNSIQTGDHLMVVDEIRVEPADALHDSHRGGPAGPEPVALLVTAARSRFTVTIESCEIAALTPAAGKTLLERQQTVAAAGCPRWPEPAAQGRGRGWIYDVFTPPSVFLDRQSGAIAAVPADEAPPADSDVKTPDLQLLQVRRGVFRLQLAGYARGRDGLRGIFVDTVTGETVIGRAGDHLARHKILLEQLLLSRSGAREGQRAAAGEPVATAMLMDESTGEEIALTTRGPCLAGPLLALFGSHTTPALRRELKEGDAVECEGVRCQVLRIEMEPPLAVVESLTPGTIDAARQILIPQRLPSTRSIP